jgi:uncharacterized membrane protein
MTDAEQAPRRGWMDLAAALVLLGGLGLAAFIWRYGPAGPLPMHIGLTGRVDGWGDRASVAGLIALTSVFFAVIYIVIGVVTLGAAPSAQARRGVNIARQLLVFVQAMVLVLVTAMAYGGANPQFGGARLITAILALMVLVVGAVIGKTGPNPFVGVRTYWTMRSRLAWDKSNRLAGRLMFWIGLIGLIACPFADPRIAMAALVVAILAAAIASVIESWRVWRADPERLRP